MQLVIPSRKGQNKPWTGIPRINWAHPLTWGLASYCLDCGGGVYIDLVSGSVGKQVTNGAPTAPVIQTTRFGRGWKFTASGTASITAHFEFINSVRLNLIASVSPYSCATGIISTATPTNTAVCFSNCDTANNTGFALGMNTSNNLVMSFSNGSFVSDAAVIPTNTFSTLVAVKKAATTGTTYSVYPGHFIKTAQSGLGTASLSGLIPCIADATQGTGAASYLNFFNGYIFYGAVWKRRALNDDEVRLLNDDPWCFLIFPEDEIGATLVGAAAGSNTQTAGWYQPLGIAPPVVQAQPGSTFVPFNTPQTVVTTVPQGWESILTPTPAVARAATPAPSLIVPLPPISSGWQSTPALAPAVVQPQSGYSFVPFNTRQTNTATIDKWQQPLSIPVLAPPVQLGATFVPFNTLQLNTAPLGWYRALSITPPPLPAQLGSISLSYNIAPITNTIPGMGWFQALAATPASAPTQLGASFVPFNTPQTTTTVSPWGWYQPLSLAPAVATAVATQPTWVPAPFPTFSLAWQQPLSIAPPVTTAVYTQFIWTPTAFPTFTLAWQQSLASTPTSQAAQLGTTVLPYNTAPLANTIPGMGWYQPLSTAPAVAIADQSSTFVPFNTPQAIVAATLIQRTLTGVGL